MRLPGLFVAVIVSSSAWGAEVYPAKPIRMIVPVAPGGGADITARAVGLKMAETFGQQVIIDNRAGAGGIVGFEAAARAAPDGYTVLQASIGPLVVTPQITKKLPYDVFRDYAPVARAVSALNMLVVHPSLPVHSVKEFIAYAKNNPGRLNYGSSGAGRADHLAGEMFNAMAGVSMQHVPYKGGAPAMTDLLSGSIQLIFATLSTSVMHVKAGKIRAIAMTSMRRWDQMPDIPTVDEAGVPGFAVDNWYGFAVPKGTPPGRVALLHREINRSLELPEVKTRLAALGIVPFLLPAPEAFGDYIRAEHKKYGKVVADAGIPVE
jgi:tripartite-type tricarboxylate transporter receptor subunit TctC